jgi:hypothetical protein
LLYFLGTGKGNWHEAALGSAIVRVMVTDEMYEITMG